MEGKNTQEIKQKFSDVYMTGMKANWTVWPAFQAVNFSLVPLRYRLPAQQTGGIAWTVSNWRMSSTNGQTFLSMLNARQDKKAAVEKVVIPQAEGKEAL